MSTAHSNSPQDLVARLETMALMSDVDLPVGHVREQIASTIQLIVHVARLPGGRRVVARVTAVEGLSATRPLLRDVFVFRGGPEGGRFEPTGHVPAVARSAAVLGEGTALSPGGELVGYPA